MAPKIIYPLGEMLATHLITNTQIAVSVPEAIFEFFLMLRQHNLGLNHGLLEVV